MNARFHYKETVDILILSIVNKNMQLTDKLTLIKPTVCQRTLRKGSYNATGPHDPRFMWIQIKNPFKICIVIRYIT